MARSGPRRRGDPARRTTRARRRRRPGARPVLVACSGGADSLALLAAAVFEARDRPWSVIGVTVDHGLRQDSAERAVAVVAQMAILGADETATARVAVTTDGHGPEAAAREARYAVLEELADRFGSGRGAPRPHARRPGRDRAARPRPRERRSVAGRHAPGLGSSSCRPLLDVTRAQTEAACRAEGIEWWTDPANDDPRFTRNRGAPHGAADAGGRAGAGSRCHPRPDGRPGAARHRGPRRLGPACSSTR